MTPEVVKKLKQALAVLDKCPADIKALDRKLRKIFADDPPSEEALRAIVEQLPRPESEPACFEQAKALLRETMHLVGKEISLRWADDRYVRAQEEED